jgi:hypothetical protein
VLENGTYSGRFDQFKEGNPWRKSPSKQETEYGIVANWYLSFKSPEDRTDVTLVVLAEGDEFLKIINLAKIYLLLSSYLTLFLLLHKRESVLVEVGFVPPVDVVHLWSFGCWLTCMVPGCHNNTLQEH